MRDSDRSPVRRSPRRGTPPAASPASLPLPCAPASPHRLNTNALAHRHAVRIAALRAECEAIRMSPRIDQTIRPQFRHRQNRLELLLILRKCACRCKASGERGTQVAVLARKIVNARGPFVHIVPRRMLLTVKKSVLARAGHLNLVIRAGNIEPKRIRVAPWIAQRV